jgi:ABC-type nitrate/sulfonate/bicarbonate transport system ATPase subunit
MFGQRRSNKKASGPAAEFQSLSFEGLTHRYGTSADSVVAVRDLTLDVKAGEIVTIVGPSGCGKSTLFNVASGLAPNTPGQVLINGEPLKGINPYTAYMFQHDGLLDWRDALSNVTLGQEFLGVKKKDAEAAAKAQLSEFGLEDFGHSHPYELSGGMRQRVALMRTYATDRPLLLLDEPFGALDALTRLRMQEFLLDRWDHDNRTVLFITHDVDEAILLGDRVIVLSERPATVREELKINLPRPRRPEELARNDEYVELRAHILSLLNAPKPVGASV